MTKEQNEAVFDANWTRLWYFVNQLTQQNNIAEDIAVRILNDFFKANLLITGPEETKWLLYKKAQEAVQAYFIDTLGIDKNTQDDYSNTMLDVEFIEAMYRLCKDDLKKIPANASEEERDNAMWKKR